MSKISSNLHVLKKDICNTTAYLFPLMIHILGDFCSGIGRNQNFEKAIYTVGPSLFLLFWSFLLLLGLLPVQKNIISETGNFLQHLSQSLWSGYHWKDLFLLENLSVSANIRQRWWPRSGIKANTCHGWHRSQWVNEDLFHPLLLCWACYTDGWNKLYKK